jgi:oligopeptide/dipeptide ABC transporter ATP-binding protein
VTVGWQIAEVFRFHRGWSRRDAWEGAVAMLRAAEVPSPETRAAAYPHQLSGGMRQRAMIGMALACQPSLLIADEPTTALDVTVQAQVLNLVQDLSREHGTAVILITHDMGVIARMCDRVVVMYGGHVMESTDVRSLFRTPRHPYTAALLRSLPRLGARRGRLESIEGAPARADRLPPGCPFAPRCPVAEPRCAAALPPLQAIAPGHVVRCVKATE